ncbi:MAG: CotH kinase family protein [Planctomycetes bacterium]|nr:CotH kinase family protein [Planctomycetota bacterium]
MKLSAGDEKCGIYEAVIGGQPEGTLVRFLIKAANVAGAERIHPSPNSPRPNYSYIPVAPAASARIPRGLVIQVDPAPSGRGQKPASEWNGAFAYVPAGGGAVQTFDPIGVVTAKRKNGFKLRFQKDRLLNGMAAACFDVEGSPRCLLSEPLSHELYRLAGVPAPFTEHIRIMMNGRPLGYRLLIEKVNKSFLSRNQIDPSGDLYKVVWYGKGVAGKHQKKTNPKTGNEDLLKLIDGLNKVSGAEEWQFIVEHFHVEEVINYFSVCMCISDWDGFHNNYFTYRHLGGTGKWEMYPWDKDKTWGDFDGAPPRHDWYEMPLMSLGFTPEDSPSGRPAPAEWSWGRGPAGR